MADERIVKMQNIYTREYYTTPRNNEIMQPTATGMGLEDIMSSKSEEGGQTRGEFTYLQSTE